MFVSCGTNRSARVTFGRTATRWRPAVVFLSLQIAQLQTACEKKSVRVRELQRSQACVLSRLEESIRRREEAWSSQQAHAAAQLQVAHTHTHTPSGVFTSSD